ncbi:hypothetical protein D1007_10214 [Hordeum vulgare]|nr:hypothetical protein D1007_10214 [Hordeum vulgare]
MSSKKKYTFPRPASTVDSSQPKQRKPMTRLAGISDAEWRADVQRREAVTTNWQRRLDAKRIRGAVEAAAMAAAVDQEEASRTRMMKLHGGNSHAAWRGR